MKKLAFTQRLMHALAFGFLIPIQAYAHVTLETKQAYPNTSHKAVLRVNHGCGTSPTLKLRVQIPDGFINVKPMPKAGWGLETIKSTPSNSHDHSHVHDHAAGSNERVTDVIWSGHLLDEHYDEFVLTGTIGADVKPGTTLWFPTIQECESSANRWIEIPAQDKNASDYKEPAPGLKILAPNK